MMWRLKIADGVDNNINDPYIFTTNNFVGRQIWEFDPHHLDYGTPDDQERTDVEAARQNFWKNRFRVRPSSDLIWRMQVIIIISFLLSQLLCHSPFKFNIHVFHPHPVSNPKSITERTAEKYGSKIKKCVYMFNLKHILFVFVYYLSSFSLLSMY